MGRFQTESLAMTPDSASLEPLTEGDYDELHQLLDDVRARDDETPQWEFFEGALAALVSCRREIQPSEHLLVLLNMERTASQPYAPFADEAQFLQFADLWLRRLAEVTAAITTEANSQDEEVPYLPKIQDLRSAVAALTPRQRAELGEGFVPALAQIWAIGFMYVVESWPQEWVVPCGLSRETTNFFNEAMQSIVDLTEDDPEPPSAASAPATEHPGVSERRQDDVAKALWAVVDLCALWQQVGPRIEIVRRSPSAGRNDPCPCGSGKKYKKCCGAG